MTWPAARQDRFARMWDEGEKVMEIADAFGITVDAVYSRARNHKLKPRRAAEWSTRASRRPAPIAPTPWEVIPLPPEPAVMELPPDKRRYAIWARARDGAREALRA